MGIFYYKTKINYRLNHRIAIIIAVAYCLFMLIYPDISIVSARKGINLWLNNILPTMFPFFICANFMNNLGVTSYLRPGAFAFFMSIFSGYPMGAKVLGDMCRKGIITKKDCKKMMGFCSTSGPAFMLGTIGTAMIGNHMCGVVIMLAHYLGTIVNGAIFCILLGKKNWEIEEKRHIVYQKQDYDNVMDALTGAIGTSFKSMGLIMAYVIMFMTLVDGLGMSGIYNHINNPLYLGMIKGMLEMTIGCAHISGNVAIPILERTVTCCMLVSFGGLSIIGQSMSMLNETGISLRYMLVLKTFQAIIAGIFAYTFMCLFFI